mgnify:FL=1
MGIVVNIQKQGDSFIIELPSALELKEGAEYFVEKQNDGTILLVPKIDDYFEMASEGEFAQPLEWKNIYTPTEREEVE